MAGRMRSLLTARYTRDQDALLTHDVRGEVSADSRMLQESLELLWRNVDFLENRPNQRSAEIPAWMMRKRCCSAVRMAIEGVAPALPCLAKAKAQKHAFHRPRIGDRQAGHISTAIC